MRKSLGPNYLGTFSLNQCRKTTIKELKQTAENKIPEIMHTLGGGIELEYTKGTYGGCRCWFKCGNCGRRCFTLYEHPITLERTCRHCLGFGYAKQRFKGMIEEKLYK